MVRKVFEGIESGVNKLLYLGVYISGLLILALMVMMMIEVVSRYVFNAPTKWVFETCGYTMLFVGAFALGYILLVDKHIRVDLFLGYLPQKTKRWFDLLYALSAFAFAGVLSWNTFKVFTVVLKQDWRSATELVGLILWPVYLGLFLGFLGLAVESIFKIWHSLEAALTNQERTT